MSTDTEYKDYCDVCGNYQTTFEPERELSSNKQLKCLICESNLEEKSMKVLSLRNNNISTN